MDSRKPKEEEEFLAQCPSWLRKALEGDFNFTPAERADFARSNLFVIYGDARDAYLEILKKYPYRLREYRKLQRKLGAESAVWLLPSPKPGRPLQDDVAREAEDLERAGLSQPNIALELNRRYPDRKDRKGNPTPFTGEAVRKMLARRRRPDKT